MRSPRFCSECGEKLLARHRRGLRARAFCKECAPPAWRSRSGPVAALVLLIALSFAAGRYTGSREPFYFIGTPVDLAPASDRLAENNSLPSRPVGEPVETTTALCGAPTKSGAPCRRRVRGGGYCFQHRDKTIKK
ncbi:MAG TPA: hypothetical protein VF131_27700 [Blastocatellia bacterium]|nr:hypothetical protein [Blastocatellia bacterium]